MDYVVHCPAIRQHLHKSDMKEKTQHQLQKKKKNQFHN